MAGTESGSLPQQPYFLRAMYEWCVDSGYTPYLTVNVDARTSVPKAYVRDGRIVLNIGPNAVRNLQMDNDWVTFSARFGGTPHAIEVPVANVLAIHAKETGEGMAFVTPPTATDVSEPAQPDLRVMTNNDEGDDGGAPPSPNGGGKPRLRVVK